MVSIVIPTHPLSHSHKHPIPTHYTLHCTHTLNTDHSLTHYSHKIFTF